MAHYDDMDTTSLALAGFYGSVGTFVIVLALQVLYYGYEADELQRKSVGITDPAIESVVTEQRGKLARYGWIDREQQLVSIPIEQAMAVVVQREQKATKGATNDVH